MLCRGLQTGRGLLLGEEPHLVQVAGPRLLVIWRTELGFLDTRCGAIIIVYCHHHWHCHCHDQVQR